MLTGGRIFIGCADLWGGNGQTRGPLRYLFRTVIGVDNDICDSYNGP
jgi:hypothetical protein